MKLLLSHQGNKICLFPTFSPMCWFCWSLRIHVWLTHLESKLNRFFLFETAMITKCDKRVPHEQRKIISPRGRHPQYGHVWKIVPTHECPRREIERNMLNILIFLVLPSLFFPTYIAIFLLHWLSWASKSSHKRSTKSLSLFLHKSSHLQHNMRPKKETKNNI